MTAMYQTRPQDLLAAIGPHIGSCCLRWTALWESICRCVS